MKESKIASWFSSHKEDYEELCETLIIILGSGLLIGGTALALKGNNSYKSISKIVSSQIQHVSISEIEKKASALLSDVCLENLSGEKLCARQLGSIVGCSDRTINKLLVSKGLAERVPSGGYVLTEAGRLIGEKHEGIKGNYWYTNLIWDKKVLELLFSEEELANKIA